MRKKRQATYLPFRLFPQPDCVIPFWLPESLRNTTKWASFDSLFGIVLHPGQSQAEPEPEPESSQQLHYNYANSCSRARLEQLKRLPLNAQRSFRPETDTDNENGCQE